MHLRLAYFPSNIKQLKKLKTDRKYRTMIESSTGQWLRKDSDNSDKIIVNLKKKKKKTLEKLSIRCANFTLHEHLYTLI